MTHKKWSEEQESKLVQLYEEGLTNKEICEQLNRTKDSVSHRISLLKRAKTIEGFRRRRTGKEVYNSNANRIIENFKNGTLRTKHKISDSTAKISKENKEEILWFDSYNLSLDASESTRCNYILHLKAFALELKDKKFQDANIDEDIIPYIKSLQDRLQSWKMHRASLKSFYNEMLLKYSDKTNLVRVAAYFNRKLKGKKRQQQDKTPDHLSRLEVVKLVSAIKGKDKRSIRNRAILATLYDSGARVSELIAVAKDNCNVDEQVPRLFFPISKTEPRNSPMLKFSLPYLKEWISVHEFWDREDAPLFYSMSTANYGEPIAQQMLQIIVRNAVKLSGINKKIHPHSLRHSKTFHCATMNPPVLMSEANKMFGWGKSSNMFTYYTQVTDDEIELREKERAGELTPEQLEERKAERNAFVSSACNRCHTQILPDQFVCPKCGLAKNKKVAEIEIKKEKESEDRLKTLENKMNQMIEILSKKPTTDDLKKEIRKRGEVIA